MNWIAAFQAFGIFIAASLFLIAMIAGLSSGGAWLQKRLGIPEPFGEALVMTVGFAVALGLVVGVIA